MSEDIKKDELQEGVFKEFIDDENYEKFRLMTLYNKQQDAKRLQKAARDNRAQYLARPECVDIVEDLLSDVTVEDIKKMSDEEVNKFFDADLDEDERIDIANPENYKFNTQFKRDFLVFQKQVIVASEGMAEEQRKIDEEVAKCQDEMNALVKDYASMNSLIKATLVEKIANSENEHDRKLYQSIMKYYDNGKNLNNVIEFAKSYKAKNIYSDFVMDGPRSQYVYRTYKKECEVLKLPDELPRLSGLESKFLPEKYHGKTNLFMYTVMAYIASWHNKNTDIARGLFVTEFITNVKNLFYDKFESEEDKETFLTNITTVLDLING